MPAGFQEFYLPLPVDPTQIIFDDVNNDYGAGDLMHYVIGVTASADNTVVYYDHWENGYLSGVAGDETIALDKGETFKFESGNIPTDPRGTEEYYDGGDRIYVSGSLLQVVVSTWPEDAGTLYADAWEIYPVQAWESNYVVPVGEDLSDSPYEYTDFEKVWIEIMSASDGNDVDIRDPTGTLLDTTTIDRGIVNSYTYEVTGSTACTVTSTDPVEVQVLVGDPNDNYEMRGFTMTPQQYWGLSYYAPVPSRTSADNDIYIYNPNPSQITIN